MVKATAVGQDGRAFLVLGLSAENVKRLFLGHPIVVECAQMKVGAPLGRVVIFAAETENGLMQALEPLIGPGTEVQHVARGGAGVQ